MKFLVELDHPKSGHRMNDEGARVFLEEVLMPTLERAQALVEQGRILAGGPVAGSIALRFIVEVESPQQLDEVVSSIPLWSVAYTRVTPLIEFNDRHWHGRLLQHASRQLSAAAPPHHQGAANAPVA